jgi:hypothetical protein
MPILGSSASQSGRTSDSPTITGVTAGNGQATITFTEPTYKGKGSVTYTATSSPSGITATGTSPITVSGLSNGTSYTFTVTALTASGVSTSSSASSSVTPVEPKNGYWAGGYTSDFTSTINKLNMTTESTSALSSTLSHGRGYTSGMANSPTAGYIVAGYGQPADGENLMQSTIQKLTFNTEARTTLANVLGVKHTNPASFSNNGTAGYVAAGEVFSTVFATYSSSIFKLAFSNESTSTLGVTSSISRSERFSCSNSGTAGYVGGGSYALSGQMYKITYSNDSKTTISESYAVQGAASFSNSGAAGYILGGEDNGDSDSTAIKKFLFSNETLSTLATTLNNVMPTKASGFANNGVSGYYASGQSRLGNTSTSIFKLTFSNDSGSILSAKLNASQRWQPAGFANSGTL